MNHLKRRVRTSGCGVMKPWEDPLTPLTSRTWSIASLNPAVFVCSPFVLTSAHTFSLCRRSAPRPHSLSAAGVLPAIICCRVAPGTESPHAGTLEGAFLKSFWFALCSRLVYSSGHHWRKLRLNFLVTIQVVIKLSFASFTHIAASYMCRWF